MRLFRRGFDIDAVIGAEAGTAVFFLIKESDDGEVEDDCKGGSTEEEGGEEGG